MSGWRVEDEQRYQLRALIPASRVQWIRLCWPAPMPMACSGGSGGSGDGCFVTLTWDWL